MALQQSSMMDRPAKEICELSACSRKFWKVKVQERVRIFFESVVYVPGVILIMSQDYPMYYAEIGIILNITSRAAPSNLGGTHQFRIFEC